MSSTNNLLHARTLVRHVDLSWRVFFPAKRSNNNMFRCSSSAISAIFWDTQKSCFYGWVWPSPHMYLCRTWSGDIQIIFSKTEKHTRYTGTPLMGIVQVSYTSTRYVRFPPAAMHVLKHTSEHRNPPAVWHVL